MRPAAAALALATLILASCGTVAVSPWTWSMPGEENVEFTYFDGICPMPRGGCAALGRVGLKREATRMLVVRLDASGDVLLRSLHGDGEHVCEGYDAALLGTGELVCVGVRADGPELSADDTWAVALDRSGGVLWERTFLGLRGSYDLADEVEPYPDGGFVMACEVETPRASNDVAVVRVDGDGETAWTATVGGDDWEDAGGMVVLADGSIMLLLTSGPWDVPERDWRLVRISPEGETLEDERLDSGRADDAVALCPDAEGGLYLVGVSGIIQAGDKDVRVVRRDSSGDVLWEYVLDPPGDDIVDCACTAHGGGLLLGGRMRGSVGLLLLDPEGRVAGRVDLPMDAVEGVCRTTDGGYAACGYADRRGVVVKLESDLTPPGTV